MKRYQIGFRGVHVLLWVCMALCGLVDWLALGAVERIGLLYWLWALGVLAVLLWLQYSNLRGRVLAGSLVAVCLVTLEWHLSDMRTQVTIVVLCCYLLQMLLERYPILMDGMTLLLMIGLGFCMVQEITLSHSTVVWAVSLVALGFLEGIQRSWKKRKQRTDKEYILWILPFVMVYIISLAFLPAPEEPYDWQWAKDIYNEIHDRFVIWSQSWEKGGADDFNTALAGFSEDGYLVGSLLENDKELMTIQGTQGVVTNLYLVGKVYDTFDGRQWTQTAYEATPVGMDTLELLYAVTRYDEANYQDYIYRAGLKVWYEYFQTEYLFAPLKVAGIEECEYTVEGGNLVFPQVRGYDSYYKLTYWQMNLNHPKVYELLDSTLPEDAEVWNRVLQKGGYDEKVYTQEALVVYRQKMQEWYGEEVELPSEICAWVKDVQGQETSTIEKLRCIEAALSSMEYTRNPGALPEDIDSEAEFLHYFLGESKQGYCSYFATAFVLLARAEGIPARYVEGFCVPITGNKHMTVTSDMAHAWPEVYIEGMGWIPFEPTPGYSEIRYTSWKTGFGHNGYAPLEDEEAGYGTDVADLEQEEAEGDVSTELRGLWRALLLAMVCVSLLLLTEEQVLFRYRYQRMAQAERLVYEVHKNLWLLARLHLVRAKEETLEEFAKRTRERVQWELGGECALQCIQNYEEYLYNECEVTAEMLQTAIAEREALLSFIKIKKKFYYYYILVHMALVR